MAPGDRGTERQASLPFALPRPPAEAASVRLTPADEAKLLSLKEAVAAALFEAFGSGGADPEAVAASREVLTAAPLTLGEVEGRYRCRTLKHAGPAPFVAYTDFPCEVTLEGGELRFAKTGGSERMAGTLFPAPLLGADGRTALAYAGVEHGPEEAPAPYPEGRTEVGLFERTGEARYRLTIPEPDAGGRLDVIDLRRG